MNQNIIEKFTKLVKQVNAEYINAQSENNVKEAQSFSFKLRALKDSLAVLKKVNYEISSGNDLKGVPKIGAGTIRRINEILETGTLAELSDKYDDDTNVKNIQALMEVIGIGESHAKKYVMDYNITSVAKLKASVKSGKIKIGHDINLGLKYYGVIKTNIPRSEITMISKYLVKMAGEIDPDLTVTICGSYRRGKATSGDIDVLLYHDNDEIYMTEFIDLLKDDGFILDSLTNKNPQSKYMGFCKYKNNPVRRIDIRYVHYKSVGSALLYFTGPAQLNKIMRTKADKMNLILNEYGLFHRDKADSKKAGIRIKTYSEEDIFDALEMKYLTPADREAEYST